MSRPSSRRSWSATRCSNATSAAPHGPDDAIRVDAQPARRRRRDPPPTTATPPWPPARCRRSREAPLDAAWRDLHDTDGYGVGYDGGYNGRGGRADFSDDLSGVEDTAPSRRTLREHLGEQVRLDLRRPGRPADRGAAAGPGRPGRQARHGGRGPGRGAGLRGGARRRRPRADAALRPGGHVLPRPPRVPGRAARGAEPARPGHAGAARQPGPAGEARPAGADAGLRRGRRGPGRHDRGAPAPRPQAGRVLRRRAGARRGAGPPDAPGAERELAAGTEPGHPAPRAGEPRLPRPRRARRPFARGPGLPDRAAAERQLAGQEPGTAGRHHPEGGRRDRRAGRTASSATASGICAP